MAPTDNHIALSVALHAAVADKIRADPRIIDRALVTVASLAAAGRLHPHYAQGWRELLSGPRGELLAFLTATDERARDFRSASPFAGVLTAAERWKIWYSVRGRPVPAREVV